MSRRALVPLLCLFLATRLAGGWLADHPKTYERGGSIIGDVTLYEYWGTQVADRHRVPYRDVRIEYPPGSLPFIVGPALTNRFSYRTSFIALMVLVDAAGLAGLLLLAQRWGSLLGPLLWVVLVPLLGPIAYVRFDLVPAVATIWAVERAARGRWGAAGAWLGFGTAVKLYPLAVLPPLLMLAPRRKPLVRGAAVAVILALLPFAAWGPALTRSVLRYHLERGIEIESLWGALLLLASKAGLAVRMDFSFESLNVVSSLSPLLQALAGISVVAGVATATWAAGRLRMPNGEAWVADFMFATLAIVVALATVLSPQYILWVAALGAAATCSQSSTVRGPVLLLVPVAVLTQMIYPFLFIRLAAVDHVALVTLAIRDLLLLALAAWALVSVVTAAAPDRGKAVGTRSRRS